MSDLSPYNAPLSVKSHPHVVLYFLICTTPHASWLGQPTVQATLIEWQDYLGKDETLNWRGQ